MVIINRVIPSCYQDSVVLMRIAGDLRKLSGVYEAGLFMGTHANKQILMDNDLMSGEGEAAQAQDLILAVRTCDQPTALDALNVAEKALTASPEQEEATADRPRTLESALRRMPQANMAFISLPGQYAGAEARSALRKGLHVFLFSDNVSLSEEIRLKQQALAAGLLCMGPDCGSAFINGTALGFMNNVPRGRVGLVASSGTGLQAVACHLAALGEGISQAIGVGGRDLTPEVGGLMTLAALDLLDKDPDTEIIVMISKSCEPAVLQALDNKLSRMRAPIIFCAVGAPAGPRHAVVATTLDEAALRAVRLLGRDIPEGPPWGFAGPSASDVLRSLPERSAKSRIAGLYTGGTLAAEAVFLLETKLGMPVNRTCLETAATPVVLDLGDDTFTVGRPHPMIDPWLRNSLISETPSRLILPGTLCVLLFDLVLGRGAHPDPATELAVAITAARHLAPAQGSFLLPVGTITGVADDPQNPAAQAARLVEAGALLFPTNAAAVRFATDLVEQY